MTGAHTPGPWRVAGKGTIRRGDTDWIASVNFYNRAANARLIAAAPDLLASVIELLEPLERASAAMVADGKALNEAGEAAFDRARAAIARATSKEAQGNG